MQLPSMFTTDSGKYYVETHGNGWAYLITDNDTGEELWFQDGDAEELYEATNGFECEGVIDQYFECLCE